MVVTILAITPHRVSRRLYEDYDLDNYCTKQGGAHKYCRIGTIFASLTFWQTE